MSSSEEVTEKGGWLARMRSGLSRSSEKLAQNLTFLVGGGRIEAEDLDRIEDALIAADLGPAVAARIVAKLADARLAGGIDMARVRQVAADEIAAILAPLSPSPPQRVRADPRTRSTP